MVISATNVSGSIKGRDALSGFSADFLPGVTAVLGPDGSGKGTLLAILAGHVRAEHGQILIDGNISRQRGIPGSTVGYLPDNVVFPRHNTIETTLLHSAAVNGMNKSYANERTNAVLRLLGLYLLKDYKIADCTGDILRRTAIAQAMLTDPEVLLLDEPAAGLLPGEQMRLSTIFTGLPRGKTAIFTTADPALAESGVDHVLFISEGKCTLSAPKDRLVSCFKGKVWRVIASQDEAWQLKLDHVVTGQQKVFTGLQMRVISMAQPEVNGQVTPEEPTLRDAYAWSRSKGVQHINQWLQEQQ